MTAVLARSEVENLFAAATPASLWLELAQEGADEPTRLTIDLDPTDLESILGLTGDDEIALAFDDAALASMFCDAEVEAHGMRGALAIAVVAAAVAAPVGLAAKAQVRGQVSKAAAKTTQISAAKASDLRLLKIGITR